MNLRTITIWTTGVMSLGMICIPSVYFIAAEIPLPASITNAAQWMGSCFFVVLGWFYCSLPFIISWRIAFRLKDTVPSIILLCPTPICGIMYAHALYAMMLGRQCCELPGAVISSFLLMLPAWIIALLLNSYYVKKATADPGTSQSTAPSPAPLEGETVIE